MKIKAPFFFLFLVFQLGFTQTEELIQGKVIYGEFPLQGIEIVNLVTEKSTITDTNGKFSIVAKVEDMLVFVSEKYDYKRVLLDKEFLKKNNFTVVLTRKPEQLEEVVVFKIPSIKLSKDKEYEQGKRDELVLEKAANHPKPIGVYDGTLINSPDLMMIGGMIISLFVQPKEGAMKKPKTEFKELAKTNCTETFFVNSLKLKSEEVALFLEFCDADPKSKTILENANPLKLMDFLFVKNTEFKKLVALEKQ